MSRALNRLAARQVLVLGPGMHADGGGLYLQVGAAGGRSWIFRYRSYGRLRDMGLGSARAVSLREARDLAAAARAVRAAGRDPLEERAAAVAVRARTWGEAVDEFISARRAEWRSSQPGRGRRSVLEDGSEVGAQERQWRQAMRDHGPPADMPVAGITTDVVLACLRPLWLPRDQGGRPETATRMRGRMERIWYAERQRGNVAGDNPARWRGHLEFLLPAPEKLKRVRHHAALPYEEAPALYAALRARTSQAARALRFLLLTAARTDEVIGMPNLHEVDMARALWLIPAERMKAGVDHEVPLVAEALALLTGLDVDRPPFALSENAMLYLLQRPPPRGLGIDATVHGLRSTFRDWVAETTHHPREVAEMSLAHQIRDKTEAAYRRRKLRAKRTELMEDWQRYLLGSGEGAAGEPGAEGQMKKF